MGTVLLEARPFRPFKSSEEYLVAMKEDLAEWLQTMYPHLNIHVENFMEKLETGVALCEHANAVKQQAAEYVEKKQAKKVMTRSVTGSLAQAQSLLRIADVKYFSTAKPGTFFARDNVSNFIKWCRISLEIIECLLFESDDLIMRKNEKHVILCLLEVARRGAKFGMLAPMLVQMERQIDREIAADQKKLNENNQHNHEQQCTDDDADDSDSDIDDEEPVLMYGPVPQIVTNDLKSLDEMVRDLVEKCTCPTQFPMIRVSEGKYRIGDTKVLIFVRILRNHVMVRVGGGWDTLSHYLDKHDPCRCRSQHRTTQGARLVNKPGAADLHGSHVYYERSPVPVVVAPSSVSSNLIGANGQTLGPPMNSLNRSRSRSPTSYLYQQQQQQYDNNRRSVSPNLQRKSLMPPMNRSRSPTPNYTSTHSTKLSTNNNNNHNNNNNINNNYNKKQQSPTTSPLHQIKNNISNNSVNNKQQQQQQQQHVSTIQIPVDNKLIKTEAILQVTDQLTDHSDTTSEMSDEGYRSLGIIQDKNKQRSSLYSQNSVEDADDNEHQHIDDLNDFGLRKTQFSQRIYEDSNDPKAKSTAQESTQKQSTTPPPPTTTTTQVKEKSVSRANSVDLPKSPKSGGTIKKQQQQKDQSKISTWNGRTKQSRPSLTMETFQSPFQRNSTTRRSVSATSYERRTSSANTSPTKGRLRQELLNAVKKTDDDAIIVQQVQELLKKYGSMNVLDTQDYDSTTGSTSTSGQQQFKRTPERMSYRSPRKDSRPDVVSRIPAPIVHKA